MNARPVPQMPRRNRRQQHQRDFDFDIHEDLPTPNGDEVLDEQRSEVRDFASALHARRYSNDGYDYHSPRFVNDMTDSNLTKASTLVNEAGDEPEHTINTMLEDLQAEKDKLAAAAPHANDRIEEDETFGGEMEPDEKAVMESDLEDSASRRESSNTHNSEEDAASSRRASAMSASSSHKSGSAASQSRRESAISTSSYLSGNETSESRRESAISMTSEHSTHSSTHSGHDTEHAEETDASVADTSLYEEAATEDSTSRRESAVSDASYSTHDRQTDVSESRRESTMSGYTHDQYTEGSESRRESTLSGITHDQYTEASESRRESAYSAVSGDHGSDASASRRESAMSGVPNNQDRRSSGRTEALIQQAARDIVAEIEKQRSQVSTPVQSSGGHESVRSESRATSTRPSDAHASVKDYQSVRSESRMSSTHPSDAHSVRDNHSVRSESRMSNTRSSDARSTGDNQSVRSDSRMSSTRPSDAHSSISAKDNHSTRSDSRMPSARPSESHESINDYRSNTSGSRPPSARPSDRHTPVPGYFQASVEDEDEEEPIHGGAADEAEDNNSSQNEHEDDVFSDHSPRSSVGSMSEAEHRKLEDTVTHRNRSTRSPRISDFSRLDDDQDEEDFIPTVRETPRPPFRSPSQVRALQMSSPPPSVIGSPRSSKRTPMPTISRLGSPMSGMQYSPKKTPPRFKRNTPPLVLLHVTLLPLQWPWGHVLENAHPDDLSQGAKNVRDTWRQLQDRMGDTTCERGILLPHPQEDFEVLEERLLEALELPLRRRARILECGHYLGPSNEMTLADESDTEDEYLSENPRHSRSSTLERQTHWCGTCQSEIRYDALGPGKVFRIKIYASNGLMKAGAWEACWKEMERVDVELEPIVEPDVQDEISRHAMEQEKAMELHQPDDLMEEEGGMRDELPEEHDASYLEQESSVIYNAPSSPPPEMRERMVPPMPSMSVPPSAPPPAFNEEEERRWREEQRLREIYGHTPSTHAEYTSASETPMPSSEYTQRETPASPSAEAYARREERRQPANAKSDSLPGLLLEAFKVMMQDKKNVMIAIMGVMVLVLALRVGGARDAHRDAVMFQPIMDAPEAPTVTVTERAAAEEETAASVVPSMESLSSSVPVATPSVEDTLSEATVSEVHVSETPASESAEPSESAQDSHLNPEDEKEAHAEKIIRVVETVTEVSMRVETATVTASEAAAEAATEAAEAATEAAEAATEAAEATTEATEAATEATEAATEATEAATEATEASAEAAEAANEVATETDAEAEAEAATEAATEADAEAATETFAPVDEGTLVQELDESQEEVVEEVSLGADIQAKMEENLGNVDETLEQTVRGTVEEVATESVQDVDREL